MKKILFFLSLFTILSYSQQKTTQKDLLIDKLFRINKTEESCKILIDQIVSQYKKKYPSINDTKWKTITNKIDYISFIKSSKNIYYTNFTEKEINELIVLYESNERSKYTDKTQKVSTQLYQLGKQFGQDVARLINQEIIN
ncbi:DUF2059 domain-containing protein [Flavobacterium sp. U410]